MTDHEKYMQRRNELIAKADYIIENSDKPEGMVKSWKYQVQIHNATYAMTLRIDERYEEMMKEKEDV